MPSTKMYCPRLLRSGTRPSNSRRLVGIASDVVNYHEYGFEIDYLNIGLRGDA